MNLHESFIAEVLRTSAWKSADLDVELNEDAESTEAIDESSEETEELEAHLCPLCESELEESISDQALLEHASQMLAIFDDVEELLTEDEDSDEELEDEYEDEDEDEE